MNPETHIEIPTISHDKITSDVLAKVDAMIESVSAKKVTATEIDVAQKYGLSAGTQRRYKAELRKMFNLKSRSVIGVIAAHSQLRQALEYIICRDERSDKLTLRSAKDLSVIVPTTGEMISIEEFLKSLYPREGVNAASCFRALRARCIKKGVVKADNTPCAVEDLPSEGSIIRFLRNYREEYVAVRRGRSRQHDFETEQEPFVTRDVTQYKPGELWIGDHTELDFMVMNERGEMDRRWISAFIDIRTSLIIGYNLNWQPSSQTIALAFRAGVLGEQLRAYNGKEYQKVPMANMPEVVMIDNGKDYRSKYTQRIFGKIDFEDAARLSIQRMTKLHYTMKYHGQSKAQMERWFKTIQTMTKYLPGFKGNKYQNKPDRLKTDIKQGKLLPVEQFDQLIAMAVDTYNNRIHRTLKDQSPIICYLNNQTTQRSIDMRVLDFLMMKVANRPIRKCQIVLFGKEYYSDALLPFNGKRADVYYDPLELGFISLYVEGKFAAVASNKEMIGQEERGWLKILHDRKRAEKSMQGQLKEFRKDISDDDARRMLLEGELLNMTPVSQELLDKNVTRLNLLTGIEQQAKENQKELDEQKEVVEIERAAKRRAKRSHLTLKNISDNIR